MSTSLTSGFTEGGHRLDRNENPFGASPLAHRAGREELHRAHRYPDPGCPELRAEIARFHDVPEESVLVGNGVDEIILLLSMEALADTRPVLITETTFMSYRYSLEAVVKRFREVGMDGSRISVDALTRGISEGASLAFVCNPHNPCGTALNAGEIRCLCETAQDNGVLLAVDEAYAEYAEYLDEGFSTAMRYVPRLSRVCVLRTFSKAYGLAGLRVGYLIGDPSLVTRLDRRRAALPFNVNRVAQEAARAALGDPVHLRETCRRNLQGLRQLCQGLRETGISHVPSHTNFVLVRLGPLAKQALHKLAERGVTVTDGTRMNLPGHLRISVGTAEDNRRVLEVLADLTTDADLGQRDDHIRTSGDPAARDA